MNENITIESVLGHGEDYYSEEYKSIWKKDFDFLEKITKNLKKDEVEKLYDLINDNLRETMRMVEFISNNKN